MGHHLVPISPVLWLLKQQDNVFNIFLALSGQMCLKSGVTDTFYGALKIKILIFLMTAIILLVKAY